MSRELLARAFAAGAGPGDAPFTIDLDSTICETYGLAKEGARHHDYTGKRGYHPLLAIAAGTGDVLMSRLREGRANTARGAAHFLRETVGRVRYAGSWTWWWMASWADRWTVDPTPTCGWTVRRVTRHRIPGSVGRNSEGISGPTGLPQSESIGGKQHAGKAATA